MCWCEVQGTWGPRKEALALPLSVVPAFETQVHEDLATVVTKMLWL